MTFSISFRVVRSFTHLARMEKRNCSQKVLRQNPEYRSWPSWRSVNPLDNAVKSYGNTGVCVAENKRQKHTPVNKISNEPIARLKQHIKSFPKIESAELALQCSSATPASFTWIRGYRYRKSTVCTKRSVMADPSATPVEVGQYWKTLCNDYNLSFLDRKRINVQSAHSSGWRLESKKKNFRKKYIMLPLPITQRHAICLRWKGKIVTSPSFVHTGIKSSFVSAKDIGSLEKTATYGTSLAQKVMSDDGCFIPF